MSAEPSIRFKKRILVYLPTYNCAGKIVAVLKEIPSAYWNEIDVVVVDNCSRDGTADVVVRAIARGEVPSTVHVVQPTENLGYAGSQKLAYKLALQSPSVEWVIMLHGDGQYPPALLKEIWPHIGGKHGVVQGMRSKRAFPDLEETPWPTYTIIKFLDAIESGVLGFPRYEWHSGFVMYSTAFLRQVALDRLTTTRHIDGHLLFAAEAFGVGVLPVPIWKRYRAYPGFVGLERTEYVTHVLKLMVRFVALKWGGRARSSIAIGPEGLLPPTFNVLSPTTDATSHRRDDKVASIGRR